MAVSTDRDGLLNSSPRSGAVSVIVPVYNVDEFIVECLDSLQAQTHHDFQAILVDDGSTDTSGDICDRYAQADPRFSVLHTENRGIGAARNLALTRATGTYCFFLDPDDVITPTTLADLVQLIEGQNADIALGVSANFRGTFSREHQPISSQPQPFQVVSYHGARSIKDELIFAKKDLRPLPEKWVPSELNFEFFSCLYRTDVLKLHSIEFLPISYGEDTYVLLFYLLVSEKAVSTTQVTYWHRRNPTSTTFRYHPRYLEETHLYYAFYSGLFAHLARDEFNRAREGLDGQFFMRCLSAVERELLLSPRSRTLPQILRTLRAIGSDSKLRGLLTLSAIRCLPARSFRNYARVLLLRQYWILLIVPITRRLLARRRA